MGKRIETMGNWESEINKFPIPYSFVHVTHKVNIT